ncbi:hypothetical protein AMTRI_Chr02g224330 [Amborella trichopoda]
MASKIWLPKIPTKETHMYGAWHTNGKCVPPCHMWALHRMPCHFHVTVQMRPSISMYFRELCLDSLFLLSHVDLPNLHMGHFGPLIRVCKCIKHPLDFIMVYTSHLD